MGAGVESLGGGVWEGGKGGVGVCTNRTNVAGPKKGADRKRGLQILLEVAQNVSHFFFWRSLAQQAPGWK